MDEAQKERLIKVINKLAQKQYIFNDILDITSDLEFSNYLHLMSIKTLKEFIKKNKYDNKKHIVFLSLICIAYEKYEGNFWDEVTEKYHEVYSGFDIPHQKMTNFIRDMISDYYHSTAIQTRKINWILMQSIIPRNYLESFFEMMFEAFKYDFDGSLPINDEDLNDILSNLIGQITKKEYTSDDKFKSKLSNKSYMLIKSTRDLMKSKIYKPNIIKLMNVILRSFNDISININYIPSNKSEVIIFNWLNNYEEYKFRKFNKHDQLSTTRKQWSTTYLLEQNQMYLITKTIFLPEDIDYTKIKISIKIDDQIVYHNQKPEIIDNEGLSTTLSSIKIPINFIPFKYEMIFQGIENYNFTELQEYFIFDLNGQYKKSSSVIEPVKVVIPKKCTTNLELIEISKTFDIGYYDPRINDTFSINNQLYSLIKHEQINLKPQMINDYTVSAYNKIYPSYSGEIILIIPKKISNGAISIWVNNKKVNNYNSDITENDIALSLNDLTIGMNILEIINNESSIKKYEFFYDTTNYSEINENQFVIKNELFQIDNKFILDDNSIENNLFELKTTFNNDPIVINYYIWIPTISKDNISYEKIKDYISADSFGYYEMINIRGINAKNLKIYDENDTVILNVDSKIQGMHKMFYFDVGIFKTNFRNHNLKFIFTNDEEIVKIIEYLEYIKLQSENVHLEIIENQVIVYIDEYVGDSGLKIELIQDNIQIKTLNIEKMSNEISININNETHFYNLYFYDLNKNIYLLQKSIFQYHKKDLVRKYYKIDEVSLGVNWKVNNDSKYRTETDSLTRTYLYFYDYNEEIDMYECSLFYLNYAGYKKYYKEIKKVYVEIAEQIKDPNHIIIYAFVSDDFETLFYNLYTHQIIDSIDEPNDLNVLCTIDELTLKKEDNL